MRTSRLSSVRRGRVAMSLMIGVVLVVVAMYGQGQAPAQQQAGAQVAEPKQFRGRLPAYFGSVVDERQRRHIYDIQRRYFGQIEALKAQLKALAEKRDAEVAAVLSLQQHAEVERIAAAAKAKRDAKKRKGKEAGQ